MMVRLESELEINEEIKERVLLPLHSDLISRSPVE
jgi:hypothetical protein